MVVPASFASIPSWHREHASDPVTDLDPCTLAIGVLLVSLSGCTHVIPGELNRLLESCPYSLYSKNCGTDCEGPLPVILHNLRQHVLERPINPLNCAIAPGVVWRSPRLILFQHCGHMLEDLNFKVSALVLMQVLHRRITRQPLVDKLPCHSGGLAISYSESFGHLVK